MQKIQPLSRATWMFPSALHRAGHDMKTVNITYTDTALQLHENKAVIRQPVTLIEPCKCVKIKKAVIQSLSI